MLTTIALLLSLAISTVALVEFLLGDTQKAALTDKTTRLWYRISEAKLLKPVAWFQINRNQWIVSAIIGTLLCTFNFFAETDTRVSLRTSSPVTIVLSFLIAVPLMTATIKTYIYLALKGTRRQIA